jgi:hypothetical protein
MAGRVPYRLRTLLVSKKITSASLPERALGFIEQIVSVQQKAHATAQDDETTLK